MKTFSYKKWGDFLVRGAVVFLSVVWHFPGIARAGWGLSDLDTRGYWTSLAVGSDNFPRIVSKSSDTAAVLRFYRHTGASWAPKETIDDGLDINGGYSSLALSATNAPRVSYIKSGDGLRFASQEGTSPWASLIVDPEGTQYTSIKIDSLGMVHIGYVASAVLKYAKWDGVVWTTATVDNGGVAQYASLALDNQGRPSISYYESGNKDLKLARLTEAGWTVVSVDSTGDAGAYASLAMDSQGYPSISYFSGPNLKFARWNGVSWDFTTVDSAAAGEAVGETSLALKSDGVPLVSYRLGTRLKFAFKNSSDWSKDTLDQNRGYYSSMAVGNNGNIHISYGASKLSYARGVTLAKAGSVSINSRSTAALTWGWNDNSETETGYRIFRQDGTTPLSDLLPPNAQRWNQDGLTPNTSSVITVRVLDSNSSIDAVSATYYTLAASPINTEVTNVSATSVSLRWDANLNPLGTRYEVHKSTFNGSFVRVDGPNVSLSKVITGLIAETTYYFKVLALNGNDLTSLFDQTVSTKTWPGAPVAPGLPAVTARSTSTLNWAWADRSHNEDGFRVLDHVTGGNLSGDLPANTTYWIQTGLIGNSLSRVQVEAFNLLGSSRTAQTYTNGGFERTLAAPITDVWISRVYASSVTIQWDDSANTLSSPYDVEYSSTGVVWRNDIPVGPVNSPARTVGNLLELTPYFFRVVAFNSVQFTTYKALPSPVVSTVTLLGIPPAPGSVVVSEKTPTSFLVSWADRSNNEAGFRIVDKNTGDSLSADLPSNTTQRLVEGLMPNTAYLPQVESFNAAGTSRSANTTVAATLAFAPTDINVADVSPNSMNLDWSANGNPQGTRFFVQWSFDNLQFQTHGSVDGIEFTSAAVTGLISGTTYYVRVAAKNREGVSSYSLPVLTRLPYGIPNAPGILRGSSDANDTITWTWLDRATDEQGYRIVQESDGQSLSGDLPPNTVVWTQTGLTPASLMNVRVVAFNEAGISQSDPQTYYPKPFPPDSPQPITTTDGSLEVGWESDPRNPPMKSTLIQYATHPFQSGEISGDISQTSLTESTRAVVSGLLPETMYYFRIYYTDYARSSSSLMISTMTNPGPPWAPSQPSGTANTVRSITWKWMNRSLNEEGLRVINQRGEDVSGELPAGTTFWTQTDLDPGTAHRAWVEAYNSYGSSRSLLASGYPTLPASPTDLRWTEVNSSSATLEWLAEANEDVTYVLTQSTDALSYTPAVFTVAGKKATLTDLLATTSYSFKLLVRNSLFQYAADVPIISTTTTEGPPLSPGQPAPLERGTTSITWGWTDRSNNEDGFRVLDMSGLSLSGDLPPGTTFWVQNSLPSAGPMQIQVESFNSIGRTVSPLGLIQYTRPAIPSEISFPIVETTMIELQWSDNGNWPGTIYDVEAVGTGYRVMVSTTSHRYVFSNLTSDSAYTFRVQASNALLSEFSSFSARVSTQTKVGVPGTPGEPTVLDLDSGSLSWGWADNASNEQGFRIRDAETHSDLSGPLPANTTYWVQKGLLPFSDHVVYVESYNGMGTGRSAPTTGTTLANAPSRLEFDLVGSTHAALSWNPNSNPARLKYRLQLSSVASFETIDQSFEGIAGTSFFLSGLNPGTTYYFRLSGDYRTSPRFTSGPIVTPLPGISLSTFDGQSDKMVKVQSSAGEIRFQFLKGSFPSSVSFRINDSPLFPRATSPAHHLIPTGRGVDIALDQDAGLAQPVTLSVPYLDSDLRGFPESSLALARFDAARGTWIVLSGTVDSELKRVTATSDQLALFQIVSLAASQSVSEAVAFPNPLRPGHPGHEFLSITRLPPNARLQIYTLRGERVNELTTDSRGISTWYVNNEEGTVVASGVYLMRIEGEGGDKMLKVVVQR